jgi:hypothetical protein
MWQYPPQHVLVAVDFGQASERALRVGAAFAQRHGSAGPAFSGEALAYAHGLAASFGGAVAEKPVTSLEDLRCEAGASLMAVASGRNQGGGWFGDTAERLVRTCVLPMLFVPNRV